MLHKVHPGSNTGMYFVVLYHSLARICRKTVVKLNHQTGRNAGISGASGQCSGPAVAHEQNFYHLSHSPDCAEIYEIIPYFAQMSTDIQKFAWQEKRGTYFTLHGVLTQFRLA